MLLYRLVVFLYGLAIRLASLRKQKAKQWVEGRRDWEKRYRDILNPYRGRELIWVHCASYGEFEQGRPLIEAIKERDAKKAVVLTFFSPSGYEAFKNWDGAEAILYLPLDSPSSARRFLDIIQPGSAIFVKYEFWLFYLRELSRRRISTYLVSAVFKPHHPFFRWYGSIFRASLRTFKILFVQDEASGRLLDSIGLKNYEVSGDTRFDRVVQVRSTFQGHPEVSLFKGSSALLVAGSTWPGDEELLISAIERIRSLNCKLLIAPHETDEASVARLESLLQKKGLRYCRFTKHIDPAAEVLVLDTIGWLSRLYFHGNCAYVGGGFNGGLHNTLEPAVFGLPVLFYGDDRGRYNEVTELRERGFAARCDSATDLYNELKNYLSPAFQPRRDDIRNYVSERARTVEKILAHL